jgi:AcrR family transcriptional regulator
MRGRRTARSAPLASREELRGAHPPRQLRSLDAIQRIADAGRQLFAAKDFDEVTVADLAAGAGVSVGAFYLRFRSKEHLVAFLLGDISEMLQEQVLRESDSDRWNGASLTDVLSWYLGTAARAFAVHRGILRPATLIARQTRDPELLELLTTFNTTVHGRFRALMIERRHLITHPDPDLALNMVLLWTSAAIREAVLYREPVSTLGSEDWTQLTRELTIGAVAYLTAGQSSGR